MNLATERVGRRGNESGDLPRRWRSVIGRFVPIALAFLPAIGSDGIVCGQEERGEEVLKIAVSEGTRESDPTSVAWPAVGSIETLPARIAFGSCGHQSKPMPVLRTVVDSAPDLFLYLGDNIYGDTRDMEVLRGKYAMLGAKPEFRALAERVPILSVWDDHDYGENDAGKEYPKKAESREIFFDFWRVPADDPRREHEGIYGEHRFEANGRVLQVLLLDTRTFRDRLARNPGDDAAFKNDYRPDPDPTKTLLGEVQWRWLAERLRSKADLRIIASSIQFGHEYNGYESWTNLPSEQQRMIDLIRETRANGVLFVSGDVHWGEISRREPWGDEGYPLFDVTASGLTESWPSIEPSRFRVGDVVRENHFGRIVIDWSVADPTVRLQIIDRDGTVRNDVSTSVDALRFPTP